MRSASRLAVLLLVLAGARASAQPIPAGVLDSTGRTAYLAGATGTIDAVDLTTGDLLWASALAQVPIAVHGDRLYAQARHSEQQLRVVGFDLTRKGKQVFLSESVVFPRWVAPGGAGRSFTARWTRIRGELVLNWSASAWTVSEFGQHTAGPRKQAAGIAHIDLDSGTVRAENCAPTVRPADPLLPAHLEKQAIRWHGSTPGQHLALVLEPVPVPPSTPPRARQQALVWRTWDRATGKPGPPRELLRGQRPVVAASLDGGHLLLRDSAPSPDELAQGGQAPRWLVLSLARQAIVARAPYQAGAQELSVLGRRLYVLVAGVPRASFEGPAGRPARLHAIDLDSGKLLWSRPVAAKAVHLGS
jgi:hypothetical protein